jgi:hypothetical protein
MSFEKLWCTGNRFYYYTIVLTGTVTSRLQIGNLRNSTYKSAGMGIGKPMAISVSGSLLHEKKNE